MKPKDRLKAIEELVQQEERVSVSKMSQLFNVTEETIRRDLKELEKRGSVRRTYGGAIANSEETRPFTSRAQENIEAKQSIARTALRLIHDRQTIAADASSSVLELLKLLKDRENLTLLTNSSQVFMELYDSNITIVSTGGFFNPKSLSLGGRIAQEAIRQHHVDLLFISCKGIDQSSGICDSNEIESEIKKAMIEQATRVILLVDHTKFEHKGFIKLTDFDRIDTIVTDRRPSDEWLKLFEDHQIQILYE